MAVIIITCAYAGAFLHCEIHYDSVMYMVAAACTSSKLPFLLAHLHEFFFKLCGVHSFCVYYDGIITLFVCLYVPLNYVHM